MIKFVNAKINIGLQIVSRRADGYHNLQTIFYPVGIYAGSAEDESAFGDILEVTPMDTGATDKFVVEIRGRKIDCPPEKNLVYRATELYMKEMSAPDFRARVVLEKHLPDGAGMGGGSADAAFTISALAELENEMTGKPMPTDADMAEMALRLGADCPFFIYNRPMYGEGVGERLSSVNIDLSGKYLLVVKPAVYVSTKEAFSGIVPGPGKIDLRDAIEMPIREWQGKIENDFERNIFAKHPEMNAIKQEIISGGAEYVSMSGSGSAIYGIFADREVGERTRRQLMRNTEINPTIEGTYLLKL